MQRFQELAPSTLRSGMIDRRPAQLNETDFTPLEIVCEDAQEFLVALSPFNEFLKGKHWLFRGLSDSSFDLIPSVLRKGEQKTVRQALGANSEVLKYTLKFGEFKNYNAYQVFSEAEILFRFVQAVDHAGLSIPGTIREAITTLAKFRDRARGVLDEIEASDGRKLETPSGSEGICWPPHETWQVLALARHVGVPTRLLDWSRSSYVGAYFSCAGADCDRKPDPHRLCVWAIGQQFFESRKILGKQKCLAYRLGVPREGNLNMISQQGAFTFEPLDSCRWPEISDILPFERSLAKRVCDMNLQEEFGDEIRNSVIRFTLPVAESFDLLRLLERVNVSRITMFPQASEVMNAFRETWNWQSVGCVE